MYYFKMYNNNGELYTFNNSDFKFEGKGNQLDFLNLILNNLSIGANPFLAIKGLFEPEYTIEYHDTIDRSELVLDQW